MKSYQQALLGKIIPDIEQSTVVDAFSSYEAGGEFTIFEVRQRAQKTPLFICLFNNELRLTNPFDPRPISEIELGFTWKIKGCFNPETLQVVAPGEYSGQRLDILSSDDSFYAYLLDRLRKTV